MAEFWCDWILRVIAKLDWFKGKFTGKPHIEWENLWFPVDFPLNQSIDYCKIGEDDDKSIPLHPLRFCSAWRVAIFPEIGISGSLFCWSENMIPLDPLMNPQTQPHHSIATINPSASCWGTLSCPSTWLWRATVRQAMGSDSASCDRPLLLYNDIPYDVPSCHLRAISWNKLNYGSGSDWNPFP